MSHTRLFVGNVPENISHNDLQEAFSSYGQIISVDLKSKTNPENDQKKFAFITLSGSHHDIESCIKHFSSEDFSGSRLYVTRARESFLERLQRERSEAQGKEAEKKENTEELPKKNPVLKLGDKLNPRKRKLDHQPNESTKSVNLIRPYEKKNHATTDFEPGDRSERRENSVLEKDKKKIDSDKKRMESLKKKRQEFKEKQKIIKTGLVGVDKVANKKIKFSDSEEDSKEHNSVNGFRNNNSTKLNNLKSSLFEDDESDDDVNFEIKKQFEGKKGQKVLDLQLRYKSDKRFVLDERFIDGQSDDDGKEEKRNDDERVDLEEADEKTKQLNILQDVLGVEIKTKPVESDLKKNKSRLGMLRFDPSQPDHAKFLAPVEDSKEDTTKKSKKKKKDKVQENDTEKIETETEKVQVSKEQFYKVSETLKEALEQPTSFSLRSLFGQSEENNEKEEPEPDSSYIPLTKGKDPKVKNPLDPSGRNPFIYDSSDSEDEELDKEVKKTETQDTQPLVETKGVWQENLFFTKLDSRLIDGLAFFNKSVANDVHKERRELKSVMKKRIYNKERKNQMFQKKIGGRKKTMKKSYRIKS